MPHNHQNLLEVIEKFSGALRGKTFRAAAEFVLQHDNRPIVETGCFHGDDSQGRSTLVLGLLAQAMRTNLISIDVMADHIKIAQESVKHLPHVQFKETDSVRYLSNMKELPALLYLDSYDHDPANPLPCQMHMLAELGAAYGKFVRPCAVLLDDNIEDTGGKTKLAKAFLEERGWRKVVENYQVLYVLE